VPRRERRERQRGRLFEGRRRPHRKEISRRNDDELGARPVARLADDAVEAAEVIVAHGAPIARPAADAGRDPDAIARLHERHELADFADDSGAVATGDDRQRELVPGDALSDPDVEVVERRGPNLDESFGFGAGRSTNLRASGPPCASTTTAFISGP
jgi:hypothetical protein